MEVEIRHFRSQGQWILASVLRVSDLPLSLVERGLVGEGTVDPGSQFSGYRFVTLEVLRPRSRSPDQGVTDAERQRPDIPRVNDCRVWSAKEDVTACRR